MTLGDYTVFEKRRFFFSWYNQVRMTFMAIVFATHIRTVSTLAFWSNISNPSGYRRKSKLNLLFFRTLSGGYHYPLIIDGKLRLQGWNISFSKSYNGMKRADI